MGGGWSMPRPGCFTPSEKELVPIVQEAWWGPQGRSRRVQETSPPLGFNPQTVQPVVSHYTDYTIGHTYIWKTVYAMKFFFTNTPRNYYNRCRTSICYLFLNLFFTQEKLFTFITDLSLAQVSTNPLQPKSGWITVMQEHQEWQYTGSY